MINLINLKNNRFLSINLIFSTLMHYLTSKFTPHLKHYPIIYHFPLQFFELTSFRCLNLGHLISDSLPTFCNHEFNLKYVTLIQFFHF